METHWTYHKQARLGSLFLGRLNFIIHRASISKDNYGRIRIHPLWIKIYFGPRHSDYVKGLAVKKIEWVDIAQATWIITLLTFGFVVGVWLVLLFIEWLGRLWVK